MLKYIIILVCSYLILRFVGRFLMPVLIKSVLKRASRPGSEGFNQRKNTKKEGEVTVEKKDPSGKSGKFDDYEEVK